MKNCLLLRRSRYSFPRCFALSNTCAIEAGIGRVENGLLPATVAVGAAAQPMRLDERITFLNAPGVSIAVINNGGIECAHGYGMADVTNARPVNEVTRSQLASITKSVTAMTALSLAQADKLSLDENVNLRLVLTEAKDLAMTLLMNSVIEVSCEPAPEMFASGETLPRPLMKAVKGTALQTLIFECIV